MTKLERLRDQLAHEWCSSGINIRENQTFCRMDYGAGLDAAIRILMPEANKMAEALDFILACAEKDMTRNPSREWHKEALASWKAFISEDAE